jgi:carboxypeptidase PM20D1
MRLVFLLISFSLIYSIGFTQIINENAISARIEDYSEEPEEKNQEGIPTFLIEAVSVLQDYLRIESITGNEQAAGRFFADFCAQKDLSVEIFSDEQGKFNFAASLFPLELRKPNIIFLSHIDVVPVNEQEWSVDPFQGIIQDEYIYGRGALDSKGLAVMQLMALLEIQERIYEENLPYNVTILAVSNEEAGGELGAAYVVDNFLERLNPVLVLGEGGSGIKGALPSKPHAEVYAVSLAEKSNMWIKLEVVDNTFGHGATPALEYANSIMIGALGRIQNRKLQLEFNKSNRLMFRKIGKAEGGIRGFFIRNINWPILAPFVKNYVKSDPLYLSLLTNSITVTNMYNPPGPPNQIASTSIAFIDCRLLPGVNRKTFLKKLDKLIDDDRITVEVINESPNAEASKAEKYYDLLEASIKEFDPDAYMVPILFPAGSDNNFFRKEDIPVFGFIPAILTEDQINSVHGIDEKLSIRDLENGINIYTTFLEKAMKIKPKRKKLRTLVKSRMPFSKHKAQTEKKTAE